MATGQRSNKHNELVHCNNCGEDYSSTYRRCPFCDEEATGNTGRRGRGGKRLSGSRRGGWTPLRTVSTLFSIALILAAATIVFTIVKPLVDLGSEEPGTTVSESPAATVSPSAEPSSDPSATAQTEPPAEASASPAPTVTAPALQAAQSFTLNVSDITLQSAGETYLLKASFLPSGSVGSLTWTSSNPSSVSVDAAGKVTAVATGTATITVKLDSGYSQECIIRCKWSGTAATATASTTLTLNRTDITMKTVGETFTLAVSGTSSTPSWSSSNTSVATVSASGKVTAVANGTATITATVNGKVLKCIVRCSF